MATCMRIKCVVAAKLRCNMNGCSFQLCDSILDATHPSHLSHAIEWARHCQNVHQINVEIRPSHTHVGGKRGEREGVDDEDVTNGRDIDRQKRSNMFAAIREDNRNVLKSMGSKTINQLINLHSVSGETALSLACMRQPTPVYDTVASLVSLLIGYGANVNAISTLHRRTALQTACHYGHVDTVSLLLADGADIIATDDEPENALHIAAKYNYNTIVEILCVDAKKKGCLDTLLNTVNSHNQTPHEVAISCGNVAVAATIGTFLKLVVSNATKMDVETKPINTTLTTIVPPIQQSQMVDPSLLYGFAMGAIGDVKPGLFYISKMQ